MVINLWDCHDILRMRNGQCLRFWEEWSFPEVSHQWIQACDFMGYLFSYSAIANRPHLGYVETIGMTVTFTVFCREIKIADNTSRWAINARLLKVRMTIESHRLSNRRLHQTSVIRLKIHVADGCLAISELMKNGKYQFIVSCRDFLKGYSYEHNQQAEDDHWWQKKTHT